MYYKQILFSFCILIFSASYAQDIREIPAFTGYAIPAESWDSQLFDPKKGVSNWSNLQQQLAYHFRL